jgi:hypothetical protein
VTTKTLPAIHKSQIANELVGLAVSHSNEPDIFKLLEHRACHPPHQTSDLPRFGQSLTERESFGHAQAIRKAVTKRRTFVENLLQAPFTATEHERDTDPMGFKEPSFLDRQSAAQNARKNILEKFKAKPGPDDPAVLKRAAERQAHAVERANAQKLREAAKAEKKAREAEAAAQAAAEALRLQAEKEAAAEALKAEQKAARDARYAARKKKK